jgi:hypothetical protein
LLWVKNQYNGKSNSAELLVNIKTNSNKHNYIMWICIILLLIVISISAHYALQKHYTITSRRI